MGIIADMDGPAETPRVRHTPRGQAVRERIVDAAVKLTSERGVKRTSVDDVRDVAGVSGSQMSHYFHDKESLIRAVVVRQAESVMAVHQMPELGDLDSFAALYRWAGLFVRKLSQEGFRGGCALGSLAGDVIRAGSDTRSDVADGFDQWSKLLQHGLTAMRDRGELLPEADPEELAMGLLCALQGGALLAQLHRDGRPVRASLNTMLAHVRSFASDPAVRSATLRVPTIVA